MDLSLIMGNAKFHSLGTSHNFSMHAAASVSTRASRTSLQYLDVLGSCMCGYERPTWSRRYRTYTLGFCACQQLFSRKARGLLLSSETECSHRGPQNQLRDKCHSGRGDATIPTNYRLIHPDRPDRCPRRDRQRQNMISPRLPARVGLMSA